MSSNQIQVKSKAVMGIVNGFSAQAVRLAMMVSFRGNVSDVAESGSIENDSESAFTSTDRAGSERIKTHRTYMREKDSTTPLSVLPPLVTYERVYSNTDEASPYSGRGSSGRNMQESGIATEAERSEECGFYSSNVISMNKGISVE